jgi:hypothetical protein
LTKPKPLANGLCAFCEAFEKHGKSSHYNIHDPTASIPRILGNQLKFLDEVYTKIDNPFAANRPKFNMA